MLGGLNDAGTADRCHVALGLARDDGAIGCRRLAKLTSATRSIALVAVFKV